MINTGFEREYESAVFFDRSYPAETTLLEMDVFELELMLSDRETEYSDELFRDFDDETDFIRSMERELARKRERLATIKQ